MALNLDALELVAKAATPGPWHMSYCAGGPECWCRMVVPDIIPDGSVTQQDAQHIATFNPALVQEMIAELRRLRELSLGAFHGFRSILSYNPDNQLAARQEEILNRELGENRVLMGRLK